jgi:hypothetical protein
MAEAARIAKTRGPSIAIEQGNCEDVRFPSEKMRYLLSD